MPPSDDDADDDANYKDVRDALADVWGDVLVAVGIVLGVMGVAIGFGPLLFLVFALAFGVGACAMGGVASGPRCK
jgi:flagellar biosynthesis component FlhA